MENRSAEGGGHMLPSSTQKLSPIAKHLQMKLNSLQGSLTGRKQTTLQGRPACPAVDGNGEQTQWALWRSLSLNVESELFLLLFFSFWFGLFFFYFWFYFYLIISYVYVFFSLFILQVLCTYNTAFSLGFLWAS